MKSSTSGSAVKYKVRLNEFGSSNELPARSCSPPSVESFKYSSTSSKLSTVMSVKNRVSSS